MIEPTMNLRAKDLARRLPVWVWAAVLSLAGSAAVGLFIPRHIPRIQDEFAYLFAGETLSRFQMTNPTHPFWRFFESHHILMQPSMMAKYPAAPGLALAVGFRLGDSIFGVWLGSAGFAAAFAWMLRGFFSARWAVLGGLLVATQFGFTHYWAQTFWGGALAATGGALVFGGACRIWRQPRALDACLLGLGVALLMHTRPLEGLLACVVPAGLVLVRWLGHDGPAYRTTLTRFVFPSVAVIAASAAFLAYYNYRITGSPWRLPYLEYEQRFNGAPAFIWQNAPTQEPAFNNPAMADLFHDFETGLRRKSPASFEVLSVRLRLLGYGYFGPVLGVLALVGALWRPDWHLRLALASIVVCALPLALSYLFMPHYQAPAAALGALLAVAGLRRIFVILPRSLRRFGAVGGLTLFGLACSVTADPTNQHAFASLRLPTQRQKIADTLAASGGRHLVFVRLVKPYYLHDTWVFNYAPIDAQPVVWAWDRGPAENRRLMDYYRDRSAVRMTVHDGTITFTEHPDAPPPAP